MRLSAVFLSVFSAFAAAQSSESTSLTTVAAASTTTVTENLTKTISLSRVHTTDSNINSISGIQPTDGVTVPTTTVSSTPATMPSPVKGFADYKALDAGKIVLAGVVGIVVAVGVAGMVFAGLW
ncbi:hypothetical protein NHJ13734_008886 [Beauveria thailandica]